MTPDPARPPLEDKPLRLPGQSLMEERARLCHVRSRQRDSRPLANERTIGPGKRLAA